MTKFSSIHFILLVFFIFSCSAPESHSSRSTLNQENGTETADIKTKKKKRAKIEDIQEDDEDPQSISDFEDVKPPKKKKKTVEVALEDDSSDEEGDEDSEESDEDDNNTEEISEDAEEEEEEEEQGFSFWINPNSQAMTELAKLTPGTPEYEAIEFIANQPTGTWIGEWTNPTNPMAEVAAMVDNAALNGSTPVFVVYAVPNRDCGQYSGGGFDNKQEYLDWVQGFTNGLKQSNAIVILEPDAVGLLDTCDRDVPAFNVNDQIDNLSQAITIIAQNPNAEIYLDVGHWLNENVAANRIEQIDSNNLLTGYSTNVSNYKATPRMEDRCEDVYNALDDDHKLPCLIDTARNGNGGPKTATGQDVTGEASWCNPPGRALGPLGQLIENNPIVAGHFWIKPPGESDGECRRDEPPAGQFWLEQALGYYEESDYDQE